MPTAKNIDIKDKDNFDFLASGEMKTKNIIKKHLETKESELIIQYPLG